MQCIPPYGWVSHCDTAAITNTLVAIQCANHLSITNNYSRCLINTTISVTVMNYYLSGKMHGCHMTVHQAAGFLGHFLLVTMSATSL